MKVFISYSSNDEVKVLRLVNELKENGVDVWFDQEEIMPGDDFIERMRQGINGCAYYLLCISPSFDKKTSQSWVKHEFRLAMLKEQENNSNCIIPVRIKSGGGVPAEIGSRAYADLSTPLKWEKNINRLIRVLKL
jgi:hypothetical protein